MVGCIDFRLIEIPTRSPAFSSLCVYKTASLLNHHIFYFLDDFAARQNFPYLKYPSTARAFYRLYSEHPQLFLIEVDALLFWRIWAWTSRSRVKGTRGVVVVVDGKLSLRQRLNKKTTPDAKDHGSSPTFYHLLCSSIKITKAAKSG